jgi:hypothetical protein
MKDKELESYFKLQSGPLLTDVMAGHYSPLEYYFIDKNTIKVKIEPEEKALYALWKRADKDFVKLCGYSTFSEFFDKEGYFQVAASKNEINNMDNYVIAHVIPDALYKVRFDDELHIRINANKRHGCVEATVKLTEKELGNDVFEGNEFSLKKFACEYNGNSAIRAIDEISGRGWFEKHETEAAFLNSFAAIDAYINGDDYKPLNPYDPDYYHNVCKLDRDVDGYGRYEVGKRPEATLFFIRDSDNMTYSMVKPSLGKNIDFFPTYGDVSEKACEEVSYRKANILLEALLNKQPCLQE